MSPIKDIMRFWKRGKLILRYIEPFEILQTIEEVFYELELSQELSAVHPIFHVSMLWCYILDKSHVIHWDKLQLVRG